MDILLISETKLDDSLYPSAQFLLDGFSKPYRLGRCSNGGGSLLYIRDDIPSRLLSISNKTESFFTEINFSKKKWLICASYNHHKSNISHHLHHLGKGLDNYIGNYDNILLLGDFNSKFSEPCLNDFCDIYNLKNLLKEPTCYKNSDNPSCTDLFLTNRPRTFQCTATVETGISDFHKLVVTVLKTFYKKQRPKFTNYRNYKNFENGKFCQDLQKEFLKFNITNVPLSQFNDIVLSVLDKHAPNKVKYIRSSNCNFMTKELRKAIMHRSNEELAEIFIKHFSKIVEKLDIDETLASNIASSEITDPVFNAIKKHEDHPSIKKSNFS